ncbi:pyridoxamine 5'-phosphate oxidase-related FMN- binding protein, partial [Natrinema limicola JCM 13563]
MRSKAAVTGDYIDSLRIRASDASRIDSRDERVAAAVMDAGFVGPARNEADYLPESLARRGSVQPGPTLFSIAVNDPTVSTVPPEAERLLEREPLMAHLGTCVEGRPHVAPVWYRYADGVVEIVTTGRKLANVRQNPRVSLSIQKAEAGQARWMVSLLGTATVIDDEDETA